MRGYQYGTARALVAFQRGEDSDLALQGALLWAEHIDNMRGVVEFLKGLGNGGRGNRQRGGGVGRRHSR